MMEAKMSHLGSQEQQLLGPKLFKGMATSRKMWKEHHTR
jgi:hypothetical protein